MPVCAPLQRENLLRTHRQLTLGQPILVGESLPGV
jgi:hypothetical protein